MFLPFTGLVYFFDSLLILLCYARIKSLYVKLETKDAALKNFLYFFLYVGIFLLFMALGHLPVLFGRFDLFPFVFNAAYIIGHIFLYIAEAYIILVPLELYYFSNEKDKKFRSYCFYFLLIFGAIITIINILQPFDSEYDLDSGLTIFNATPIVAILVSIIIIIPVGFTALSFLAKSAKLNGGLRNKSIILGVGMALTAVGGPMHEIAKNTFQYLMADFLVALCFPVLSLGIYYERLFEKTSMKNKKII